MLKSNNLNKVEYRLREATYTYVRQFVSKLPTITKRYITWRWSNFFCHCNTRYFYSVVGSFRKAGKMCYKKRSLPVSFKWGTRVLCWLVACYREFYWFQFVVPLFFALNSFSTWLFLYLSSTTKVFPWENAIIAFIVDWKKSKKNTADSRNKKSCRRNKFFFSREHM